MLQIWNERNNLIFRNVEIHPDQVPMRSYIIGNEYFQAKLKVKKERGVKRKVETRNHEIIKWKPPKPSYLKINFDSSVIN